MEAHPPSCLEYREALSPRGVYGKWLREKSIAAQVGDSLFMHGGINPARPAPKSIAEVNDRARAEIRRIDAHRQRLVAKRLALPSFTLQQLLAASAAELQVATDSLAASKALGREPPTLDLPAPRSAGDAEQRHLEPARSRRATLVPRLLNGMKRQPSRRWKRSSPR